MEGIRWVLFYGGGYLNWYWLEDKMGETLNHPSPGRTIMIYADV